MIRPHQIAQTIAQQFPERSLDRYDQIWEIKKALIASGSEILATDRETIDSILDILFTEFKFKP